MILLLMFLGVVLAATTLLFGGMGPFISPLLAFMGASALVAVPFTRPTFFPTQARGVVLVAGLCVVTLFVVVLSLTPLLGVHPFSLLLGDYGLQAAWPAASLTPGRTLGNLALMLGYMGFALLIGVLAAQEAHAAKLRAIVALVVLGFALYGLVIYAIGNTAVLWYTKTDYLESLTSTFINRNMAANMLGLGVLAALACGLARVGEISSKLNFTQRMKALYYLVLRPGRGWFAVAIICFVALLMTSSRAGFMATLLATMVFLGTLAVVRPSVRWPLVGALMVVVAFVLVILATSTGLTARIAQTEFGQAVEMRPMMNALSAILWAQSGVLGEGLGAWAQAAGIVRTDEFSAYARGLEYAHNSYWQWAVETGPIGVMVAFIALVGALYNLLRGVRTRRRQVVWPALGLAVLVQQLVHGWPDAPLIMPAIVLAVMALLIPALMQALPSPAALPEQKEPLRVGLPVWFIWPTAGLGLLGMVLAGWLLWAQWAATPAAPVVAALQRGQMVQPAALQMAAPALQNCVHRNPYHPKCGADLTLVTMAQAAQQGVRTMQGQMLLSLALRSGQLALEANPAQPILAYRLARIEGLRSGAKEAMPYVVYSILAGSAEPNLSMARANLAVAGYDALSPEDKPIVQQNMRLLWQIDAHGLWRAVRGRAGAEAVLREVLASEASAPGFTTLWKKVTKTDW